MLRFLTLSGFMLFRQLFFSLIFIPKLYFSLILLGLTCITLNQPFLNVKSLVVPVIHILDLTLLTSLNPNQGMHFYRLFCSIQRLFLSWQIHSNHLHLQTCLAQWKFISFCVSQYILYFPFCFSCFFLFHWSFMAVKLTISSFYQCSFSSRTCPNFHISSLYSYFFSRPTS